jgi:hypothetical protein
MKWTPFSKGLVVCVSFFGFYSIAINLFPNNWLNLSAGEIGRPNSGDCHGDPPRKPWGV